MLLIKAGISLTDVQYMKCHILYCLPYSDTSMCDPITDFPWLATNFKIMNDLGSLLFRCLVP